MWELADAVGVLAGRAVDRGYRRRAVGEAGLGPMSTRPSTSLDGDGEVGAAELATFEAAVNQRIREV